MLLTDRQNLLAQLALSAFLALLAVIVVRRHMGDANDIYSKSGRGGREVLDTMLDQMTPKRRRALQQWMDALLAQSQKTNDLLTTMEADFKRALSLLEQVAGELKSVRQSGGYAGVTQGGETSPQAGSAREAANTPRMEAGDGQPYQPPYLVRERGGSKSKKDEVRRSNRSDKTQIAALAVAPPPPKPRDLDSEEQRIVELYRSRDLFKEKTNAERFMASVPTDPDHRSGPLIFEPKDDGEYLVVPSATGFRYAVPMPRPLFQIDQYEFAGMGTAFHCDGYRPNYRYRRLDLDAPAKLECADGKWRLLEPGFLRLGQEEKEF